MEHIHNIEIKNFKSIRHAVINDCRRVNMFVGPPNVGKSNILEGLGLLTFIRKKRPTGLDGLIRFETFTQLFNNYNFKEPVIIEFNNNYSLTLDYEDEHSVKLIMLDKNNHNTKLYGLSPMHIGKDSISWSSINDIDTVHGDVLSGLFDLNVKPFKFSESKIFNKNLSAFELDIPFGKNMFEIIINDSNIRNEFSELLKPYGLDLVIDRSANDIKVSPKMKDGILNTIPISLLADTLIRLMFFKAALFSNKGSALLFEEPEAHMYPPYISKITSDIMYDENNNQFFITTYSPFVVNDIMENLKKEEYAIYTVGYDKENGETLVKRLSDEELHEIYQYGIDLFLNLENYLPHEHKQ